MVSPLWLVLFPLIAAALVGGGCVRWAWLVSLAPLLCLGIGVGGSVDYLWIPSLDIHFSLGLDPLSLLFVALTSLIVPFSLLYRAPYTAPFYVWIFILQALLNGFFMARDLFLFTFFWEAMLLPLYFLIAHWGGEGKARAAFVFLLYMIAGSVFMVMATVLLYLSAGTFALDQLKAMAEKLPVAAICFWIFLAAFAVKTPLFPFHAWLPDAYTKAPPAGSILLAGILSKAGIYGILRVGFGLFPLFMLEYSLWFTCLAVIGVFYGGAAAWVERDFKRLIAYSSLSHVNFLLAGLFVWSGLAHTGAIVQVVNHGITIAALFLVAAWLEQRLLSTSMDRAGGLLAYMPRLCWITLFFVLASAGLPGLNNFIGEILIFLGIFVIYPWVTGVLLFSIVLSVLYLLRGMQKLYFGPPSPYQPTWIDISWKECFYAAPLIVLILWLGLYPGPLLTFIEGIK